MHSKKLFPREEVVQDTQLRVSSPVFLISVPKCKSFLLDRGSKSQFKLKYDCIQTRYAQAEN